MRERLHDSGHRWSRTSIVDEAAIDHERTIGTVPGAGNDLVRVRVAQRVDVNLLAEPITLHHSPVRVTVGEAFELNVAQTRDLGRLLLQAADFADQVARATSRPRLVAGG
ncbi:hypothetical protein Kisp01_65730 [Kineosporia sp. NBRC 101677]|uniref:hypothetical protein n=1 Tax=Kineosporia sp. NBRC 101677 TaxID=3032197 RepID=UPI0024A56A8A|nr:hypothetical protein [Kineosporia sp. NBRC 101677]GLY19559.1 hypothetical protein Kisp01_65730 [Kineosporia sp. NBRC 101677]